LNVLLLLAAAALYRQRQQKPLAYCLVLAALSWSSVLALARPPCSSFSSFWNNAVYTRKAEALNRLGIAATFLLSAVLMLRPYPGQYFDDLSFNGLYAGARALAFSLFR
jgi:hypothetical protein